MADRGIAIGLAALLLVVPTMSDAQDRPPDEISKLLFEAYLDGPRKINTSTIMAASQIVADRGRTSGFWRQVLAELKSDDEHSEVNCVRILGNMLATDAAARDAIRRQKETGEVGAWIPSVELGPEVVRELIERAKKADRFRIDHYAVALARARVPEAKNFFASILSAQTGPPTIAAAQEESTPLSVRHLDGTRFHAAVGLAQLGDPVGIEWLIANCEDPNGFVQLARPHLADRGGSIGTCCQAALQRLSERSDLTTKDEWEAWWKTADKAALANRAVEFADP